MSHFEHHVFFCTNQREGGAECCHAGGGSALFDYAKARVRDLGLAGAGRVRINRAGCLDRCELGPVLVVYPEAVWYRPFDTADIDEIIDQHLLAGQPVTRLQV